MPRMPPHVGLVAVLIAIGVAVAVPPGGTGVVLADDKGKQTTDQGTDKSKQEGVPAQCARLIKASERRRCLQKAG